LSASCFFASYSIFRFSSLFSFSANVISLSSLSAGFAGAFDSFSSFYLCSSSNYALSLIIAAFFC